MMMMARKKKKKRTELDKRLINLLVINIFFIASGFLWLDYLGLINFKQEVFPSLAKVPGLGYLLPKRMEDPYLLAKEEYKKQEFVKKMEWEKIDEKKEELEEIKMKLEEKEKSIQEIEKRLKEKESDLDKKYEEKESYQDKVDQQAVYLVSMRPEDAVKRLTNMDDLFIIDILKSIEKKAQVEGKQSIVPYFLSLMEAKRASVIQRKMTTVEEDIKGTNF